MGKRKSSRKWVAYLNNKQDNYWQKQFGTTDTSDVDAPVTCRMCRQPMKLIMLGEDKFKIWVHTGDQLKTCKALRFPTNFVNAVVRTAKAFGARMQFEYDEQGRLKVFGQQ